MKFYWLLPAVLCLPGVFVMPASQRTARPVERSKIKGDYVEVRRYAASEAGQAVAVDESHFFAITNSRIARYDRQTGEQTAVWSADEQRPLKHLNSGIVRDGKLYCAHSNYPEFPEASSVEIWDTNLNHIDSHSLGVLEGSLTWIEPSDDGWWAVFAHYSKRVNENPHAKSNRWTTLVRFDRQWRRTDGWVFPQEVLDRFEPHSCSGGGWGPDGRLYCTGHDRAEIYQLELPAAGSTLKLAGTFRAPITGQGIAFDNRGHLFGINRPRRQVIEARLESAPPSATEER